MKLTELTTSVPFESLSKKRGLENLNDEEEYLAFMSLELDPEERARIDVLQLQA